MIQFIASFDLGISAVVLLTLETALTHFITWLKRH